MANTTSKLKTAPTVRRRTRPTAERNGTPPPTIHDLAARLDAAATWARDAEKVIGKLSERLSMAEARLAASADRDAEHFARCFEMLREAQALKRASDAMSGPF